MGIQCYVMSSFRWFSKCSREDHDDDVECLKKKIKKENRKKRKKKKNRDDFCFDLFRWKYLCETA